MTTSRTLTIATAAGLAAYWMHGCGSKVILEQEVTGGGGSDQDASRGGRGGAAGKGGSARVGGIGGSTAFDGCPGLGCAPNCGDAGVLIDKNDCPTCTCKPEPDAGTAGTGGTTGCGSGTCGPLEQCFNSQFCVAKMVPIMGGYSIDATEVTRDQYAAWLETSPTTTGQQEYCSWNTDFTPVITSGSANCDGKVWPPGVKGKHPVVCVDWCDAYAFCKAVDKRLCGRMGGGPNAFSDFADASLSGWLQACSSGGANIYPYGDVYDGQKCNGWDESNSTVPVGSLSGCQSSASGYTGVYDLSGNVWEWEDSCNAAAGGQDLCRVRGGSFSSSFSLDFLRCANAFNGYRHTGYDDLGLRCCSDQ